MNVRTSRETDNNSWQVGNGNEELCRMLHPLAQKQGKGAAHMQAIIIYGTKAKHNAKYETSTRDMKCIKLFIPTKLQSAAKSRIQIMQLGELRERQKIGAKTDIMFLKNLKTKAQPKVFPLVIKFRKLSLPPSQH